MKKLLQISFFFLILSATYLNGQTTKDSYSSSSVLAIGKWFRIAITSDGIYRIDYSKLVQLGLDNPSNPRIYCNNQGQLSYFNGDPEPDDLKELSLFISGNDNVLNAGEYLLFFGQGTGRWKYDEPAGEYNYLKHNYSDTATYFITSGPGSGKRIINQVLTSLPASYYSSESDALFIHEAEIENLIKSGREWFEPISAARGLQINPGFTDIITTEIMKYDISVAARSSAASIFRLYDGPTPLKAIQAEGIDLFATTGTYAVTVDSTGFIMPSSPSPQFEMKFFNNGEYAAKGWINFVKLQARKSNTFTGALTRFNDSRSVATGRVTGFSVKSLINETKIWDISDPLNIKNIPYTKTADSLTFKATTDSLRTYIAFTSANALIPYIRPVSVSNQDLHSSSPAGMIIITHPLFKAYAEKLSVMHYNNSGLICQVVTTDQVYNEFSGGIPDIAAIRNFVRMKYEKQLGSSNPLKYLLLFGDGSYENKTLPPDNPNFIPTYQSQNSNVYVNSFTSDDFYGLLEEGEGESEGTEDIGIGRLPVSDTLQAGIILSKIKKYLGPGNFGEWKNVICLAADDEDDNTHISDAEGLATILKDSVPAYNVEKIYLDAFRQTTSVNGQSYPDVNKAINNRINSGCLIFNYVGHGNENGLAAERVVKTEDINSWKNDGRLPLFITATCEFSRFDDIEINAATREMTGKTSAGEMVLLNPYGGAIALMSTTRVVYSAPNYFLNKNILDFAFDRDENGAALCLGDIIRLAKNNSGNGPNKRNFSLLGDPALKLAYPWHGKVVTDSINGVPVTGSLDSLKALALITVSGHVEDANGYSLNDFNGVISPLVLDKESKIRTLANDGGPILEFNLRNNVLFSGKTMAENGKFRFTFIVPRDIEYSFGTGKISYYASDSDDDMNGSFTEIIVGGFSNSTLTDSLGPDIRLYINDTLFRNGGITDNNPKLLAIIEDSGGINTTGSGIGHDLAGYLDNDHENSFVLNNYFENDFDTYRRGRILYDLSGLDVGSHLLTLKAWDNFNNSSEKSILFIVEPGGKFVIKNLINYPNPFFGETRISAGYNRPESGLQITISIFNLNGKVIKIIKTNAPSGGYTLPPVLWDGNDDGGKRVGRGMYPYTITVISGNREKASATGRMIIL